MAHAGGRPSKIKSINELKVKADKYFLECKENNKIPYLTGFYVFLGVSHSYFYDLINAKPEFSEGIKAIWNRFGNQYEINMGEKRLSPAHSIFMLKNCGFSDSIIVNAKISSSMSLADTIKEAQKQEIKQAK